MTAGLIGAADARLHRAVVQLHPVPGQPFVTDEPADPYAELAPEVEVGQDCGRQGRVRKFCMPEVPDAYRHGGK